MKTYKRITYNIFILFLFFFSCDDNSLSPDICNEPECFNFSDLETKTNYSFPFKLFNDIKTKPEFVSLNNQKIPFNYGQTIEFENTGFFELILSYESNKIDTFVFTLANGLRSFTEWGIPTWTPCKITPEISNSYEIAPVYPRRYVKNTGIPFIFYMDNNTNINDKKAIYSKGKYISSNDSFLIKHGEGSIMLSPAKNDSVFNFDINGQSITLHSSLIENTPILLEGEITKDIVIDKNTVVKINSDLIIPSGCSLTINEGVIVLISESVNIFNYGPLKISGSDDNPVLFTCSQYGKYWGGIISIDQNAKITSEHTIFCYSGFSNNGEFGNIGHAHQQALFYTKNSGLQLNQCHIIDHKGQAFYSENSNLTLESILVQRLKTGGQVNYSQVIIKNSIFTDFPNDNLDYMDADNDALYISASDVNIDSSLFMYAKDDGLDSGGGEGGTVSVTNSRFEACFHEGAALSSESAVKKTHNFLNCVFFNCGQGIELGYSSPNHTVQVDKCLFLENGIGIRYGDNYEGSEVNGLMHIKNSKCLNNNIDIWNMVYKMWAPKLDNMNFENVQISSFSSQYPNLEIIK